MSKWLLYVLPQCPYALEYSQWEKTPTFHIYILRLLPSMSLFFLEQNSVYVSYHTFMLVKNC